MDSKDWFTTYTMTMKEYDEWKKYSIDLMRKELGFTKKKWQKKNSCGLAYVIR